MIIAYLSISLLLFLLSALVHTLYKEWWNPIRIQHLMRSQGIKGPAYKFHHGSTKETIKMREESITTPLENSSHHLFPRILPDIYAWKQLYGRNYLIWRGPQAQLVVTEPELIKEILTNKDGAYRKRKINELQKKLIGDGLVVTRGKKKWLKLRKIANHAFYGESLKGMIPAMTASVETMLGRWREHEGKEIEVHGEFRLLTSEVISRTAFGSSYLEGKNIFDLLNKLSMIIGRNDLKIRFAGIGKLVKSKDDIEASKIQQALHNSIIEMIRKREERVISGEEDNYGSDFLGFLINANHDPDDKFNISIDNILDECKTFYIAGQETTNGVLAWILYLLAINKDWQERARNEVLELFGQDNPNPEGIGRLKIMNMILNETLRLYGPVIELGRRVEKPVKLGKLILPADIDVYIPIIALHHDPEIWGQDVHQFNPDRFAEGVAKATNNNITAFIPFGGGPRICVGLNFAGHEAKIALSMILQRYKFTLSPNYIHSPAQIITIRPQSGIPIIFTRL